MSHEHHQHHTAQPDAEAERAGSATGRLPVGEADHTHHGHAGHEGHGSPDAARGGGGHQGNAAHQGHGTHAGHGDHVAMFRRMFWITLALAVPTVASSAMFADLVGYPLPDVPSIRWLAPVLGTVIYLWGGRPFLTGAVAEVRRRRPGMMLLIGMAITVAFVASWGATLGLLSHELEFWWELALLVAIMLLGHWLEMRSLARTSSALDSLAALLPDEAERIEGDTVVTVPPSALAVGDGVVVRPGGRVPADGEVDGVELISSGGIDLVVNSPRGRGPRADGAHLRRAAASHQVPLLTTAAAALAAANGVGEWNRTDLGVRSLQAYHQGVRA